MKIKHAPLWIGAAAVVGSALGPSSAPATDYPVFDEDTFNDALALVQPGDDIVWQNGTYDDQDTIRFEPVASGTPASPITFRAQTPGGVIFRGNTRVQFGGQHLVVSGFRFDNTDYVFTDDETSGWVIQSRAHSDLNRHAHNCRVTDCAIVNYDNPTATSSSKWVQWYGTTNRFDHNFVSGKRTRGATFIVELNPTSGEFEAHHLIDNNVFADRPPDPAGANEFETLRTGTSDRSDQNARITVASNYFYRCSGEAEIISNKSAENSYRHNTFIECAGSLTLRHGRGCTVEGNVFFGGNVPDSGGIRVANQDHIIVNNYMQDLAGTSYQAALAIMNGTNWNPPSNPDLGGGYVVVKDSVFAHNTIVDAADAVNFGVGNGSSGRNTPPRDNTLAANIIVSSSAPLFTLTDTPVNTTYLSNLIWGAATGLPVDPDLIMADPLLTPDAMGVQRPSAAGPAAGTAGTDLLFPGDLLDMDGALRPVTGRDIGCDEIAQGALPAAPLSMTNVGPSWVYTSTPPTVTSDPQSVSNAVGTTISLSASATGGVPLFYQWRKNGANLIEGGDISGSDEATVLIANADLVDAGNYDVIVQNAYGASTSAVAVVTVFVPTFPPGITSQPTNQTVLTGANATFTVVATGTAPLSYQWYFDTTTSLLDETNSSLTLISVDASDEGDYHVEVSNAHGTPAVSDAATLTVIPTNQPPTITVEPVDDTVTQGQTANFSVTAIGAPPLSYQWYYNTNTALGGETSSSLSIPSAQTNDAGYYSVVVSNAFGTDPSVFALLTVNPGTPAGTYQYDSSPGTAGIQDGGSDWTSVGMNWLVDGTPPNVLWDDSGPNDAVFGGGSSGTAGFVDIPSGETRTVGNMTFIQPNDGEYVIDAGGVVTTSVLNLSGTPTITVDDWPNDDDYDVQLKIILSGSGFIKEGPGTLRLGGGTDAHNTYSGLVTVNDGTLLMRKNSDNTECITAGGLRINTGGTVVMPKKGHINDAATVTVAGGTLRMVSSGGDTFGTLVVDDGGVVVNEDNNTNRELTMTTAIDVRNGTIDGNAFKEIRLKGAAGLTKTTGGTGVLGPKMIGRYTGATVVDGGILMLNGTIEDSPSVTVNSGGTLGGTGEVENIVSVQSGGTLAPGASIGTFTVGDLVLAAGSATIVDVNASSSASDLVTGFSSATYAGDLQVNIVAGTAATGQTYQIFSAGGSGGFAGITPSPGPGLGWSFDSASGVLSVVSSIDTTPPELDAELSGGNINFCWPATHTGWQLQYQTNGLGAGLWTWPGWPGSTLTNEIAVPIDPAHSNVFYRLVYPPIP
jgi:poly(beta-D-mannuronate) lyase